MANRHEQEVLEEELQEMLRIKEFVQKKIDRLRHQIRYENGKSLKKTVNVDRTLFVPTNCITPYVLQCLKTETVTNLANKSGVSPKTITNILDAETEFTSDQIAEALFLAMGLPHIYAGLTPVRLTKTAKQANPPEPPPSQYFEE